MRGPPRWTRSARAGILAPMLRLALTVSLLAACAAPVPTAEPAPAAPAGGVLRADPAPPPGATTWGRPTWRVGDRFELLRGGRTKGAFTVTEATAEHYALDPGNRFTIRRDLDLGNLGEWDEAGVARHRLTPVDTRYHWPLWVGKTWSCAYHDEPRDRPAIAMQADYVVEDLDTITVPAGTFEALRIVRTLRLVGDAEHYTRCQIAWYAPAEGVEVRQFSGDTLIELVAHTRAP